MLRVACCTLCWVCLSQLRGPMPEIVAAVVASQLTQGLQYAATRQRSPNESTPSSPYCFTTRQRSLRTVHRALVIGPRGAPALKSKPNGLNSRRRCRVAFAAARTLETVRAAQHVPRADSSRTRSGCTATSSPKTASAPRSATASARLPPCQCSSEPVERTHFSGEATHAHKPRRTGVAATGTTVQAGLLGLVLSHTLRGVAASSGGGRRASRRYPTLACHVL
jgi:hypothetical protein